MAFQFKICCKRFSSNNLTFLSGDSATVCHISLHMCRSSNFPQILTTIGLSIRFSLLNASQRSCLNNLINPLTALAHHHLSPSLDLQLAQLWESLIAYFDTHHLISGSTSWLISSTTWEALQPAVWARWTMAYPKFWLGGPQCIWLHQ